MTDIAGQWYRVSSDTQDEENQRQTVTGLIAARGYALGPEYVAFDKSATKREHLDKLNEAIEDMRAGRINVLVMRHTDRIDRTEDLGEILKRVKAAGGRIESASEQWLEDFTSLPGKVMTSVTEFMNAEYTRKLSVNVKNSHDTIRANGYWTGSVPFGYVTEGETGRKTLVPDAVNAALAVEVFERMADGRTASSIAAWLDTVAPQVIRKTGKRSPWRAKRVIDMVGREIYKGVHPTHTGFEALVSEELWSNANAAKSARSFETGGRRGDHGYSGAVYCECGGVLYRHQSMRNGKAAGMAKLRCSKGRRGIGGEETCGREGIPFDAATEAVDALMAGDYRDEYVLVTTGGDAERQAQIKALEADMAAANKRKDRKAVRELLDAIEELEELPPTPVITRSRKTGRTIADVWASSPLADRRAFLKGRSPVEFVTVILRGSEVRARLDVEGEEAEAA